MWGADSDRLIAEDLVTWSPGGNLGDVQTSAVYVRRIQELEKELQKVHRENRSLAGRLQEYKVFVRKNRTKLEEEQLGSIPFKR